MSILKSVQEIHDLSIRHDLKLGLIVLHVEQAITLYSEIQDPLGTKPNITRFLEGEHYRHDGVHLMWQRPD